MIHGKWHHKNLAGVMRNYYDKDIDIETLLRYTETFCGLKCDENIDIKMLLF